jgi:hypothetical protein
VRAFRRLCAVYVIFGHSRTQEDAMTIRNREARATALHIDKWRNEKLVKGSPVWEAAGNLRLALEAQAHYDDDRAKADVIRYRDELTAAIAADIKIVPGKDG